MGEGNLYKPSPFLLICGIIVYIMAHHKRKKPKNARAGCLMCKPWKMNGAKKKYRMKFSDRRRSVAEQRIND